jgi:hypothetical protein
VLVEVAWIGAGGLVAGSAITIVGQWASGRAGRLAANATIEADRRHRLWEKRTAAYEDAAGEVLARRTRREALTSRGDIGNVGSHPADEMRKAEEPGIIRIRSLLEAYASQAVRAAYQGADDANIAFWGSLTRLVSANLQDKYRRPQLEAGETGETGELAAEADYAGALAAMQASRTAARAADDEFFAAINAELSWRAPDKARLRRLR